MHPGHTKGVVVALPSCASTKMKDCFDLAKIPLLHTVHSGTQGTTLLLPGISAGRELLQAATFCLGAYTTTLSPDHSSGTAAPLSLLESLCLKKHVKALQCSTGGCVGAKWLCP